MAVMHVSGRLWIICFFYSIFAIYRNAEGKKIEIVNSTIHIATNPDETAL